MLAVRRRSASSAIKIAIVAAAHIRRLDVPEWL